MENEDTFSLPERVGDLADDVVDYVGQMTGLVGGASPETIEKMVAEHDNRARDYHDQIISCVRSCTTT